MGFNNAGLEAFAGCLDRRPAGVLVGANLGANKDSGDRAADYVAGLRRLAGKADWFTVNVSSPNTPGLRALQGRDALDDLLGRVAEARPADGAPVFLKIAPDLEPSEIAQIVQAARAWKLDGLIVSNTTIARPADLRSPHAGETGGLSGAPLKPLARRALSLAAEASEGRLALIAAGGVDSGEEALDRIRMGAGAVQLYSALVYHGPGLVRRIVADLRARLLAEGFTTISEAVGTAR
jgi:dihydroorotate dehydrogenase